MRSNNQIQIRKALVEYIADAANRGYITVIYKRKGLIIKLAAYLTEDSLLFKQRMEQLNADEYEVVNNEWDKTGS